MDFKGFLHGFADIICGSAPREVYSNRMLASVYVDDRRCCGEKSFVGCEVANSKGSGHNY